MRGHGSSRALVFYLDHPPLETVTLGEAEPGCPLLQPLVGDPLLVRYPIKIADAF